jgi:membrane protease YdiL (CAAX protease family)
VVYVAALCGPAVGALCASFLAGRYTGVLTLLKTFRFPRSRWYVYAVAVLFPPAAWIAASFLEHGQFSFNQPWWVMSIISLKMLVRGGPLTEEVGWRGFLLPQLLLRTNLFRATLVIIPIWGLWHVPLWWLPGLPHHEWSFALFIALLLPITAIFSWLYARGGRSVWLPILFHTSVNFALHFSSVEPSQRGGSAFYVLLGIFWAAATATVLLDRELWFARKSAVARTTASECREELLVKGYVL